MARGNADSAGPARRARLLFVLNDCAFFLSHRLPIALAAQRSGYEVWVCTPLGAGVERLRQYGMHFVPFALDRSSTNPVTEVRSIAELTGIYARVRPDIVHHVSVKPVLYGTIAARIVRVPAVVNALAGLGYVFNNPKSSRHVLRTIVTRALRWSLVHRNAFVIFQNPDDQQTFLRHGIVRESQTVLIRGSGVDLSQFAPRPEPEGGPTVVLASRMLWSKGVGEFVRAAEQVRRTGSPTARFALVGESDPGNPGAVPRAQLEAWAKQGVVEWWGKRDDMPEVLAAAHVVVLPSYYGEGVPKVLIEAAASGRPIVTTDEPGCREVVRHGENGLLVPSRDVGALAQAMRELIANPAVRARMGARGRELAVEEFDVAGVVERTLRIYQRAVQASP